jgi:hypothetical protein
MNDMLEAVLVGVILTVMTVVVHAIGTTWWIRRLRRRVVSSTGRLRAGAALYALTTTAILLLMLHVLEVVIWAGIFVAIPEIEEIETLGDAVYYSFVTFTTLGYGDITLSGSWRILSGIEALNGLLLFSWSAAMLFAVVQRLWRTGT